MIIVGPLRYSSALKVRLTHFPARPLLIQALKTFPKYMLKIIENNLRKVENRLSKAASLAQRSESDIQLLAVSKTRPATDLREAFAAGQNSFGENYLQEALDKQEQLSDLSIEWHFIGPIQSNKTRAISENFDWVHSVDRVKIARRLSEQRPQELGALNICLQINLDGEDSKSGVSLEELPALAKTIAHLPMLRLRGLMAIPAKRDTQSEQEAVLAKLREALTALSSTLPEAPLDTLSMGMSGDLEAAVAAGSTLVRVGTDIFGARN